MRVGVEREFIFLRLLHDVIHLLSKLDRLMWGSVLALTSLMRWMPDVSDPDGVHTHRRVRVHPSKMQLCVYDKYKVGGVIWG